MDLSLGCLKDMHATVSVGLCEGFTTYHHQMFLEASAVRDSGSPSAAVAEPTVLLVSSTPSFFFCPSCPWRKSNIK